VALASKQNPEARLLSLPLRTCQVLGRLHVFAIAHMALLPSALRQAISKTQVMREEGWIAHLTRGRATFHSPLGEPAQREEPSPVAHRA
jgi:hypothetical protein